MNRLIDEIIELFLNSVDCHHEANHEEDGIHVSVEYSLKKETLFRMNVRELIEENLASK